MMTPIHIRLLRAAALYAQAGMALGLYMGASGDHSLFPAHAHINLLGWVTLALYGLVYRVYPEAANSRLAPWHFWLANTGALLLAVGVTGIVSGHDRFAPVAATGAAISILGGGVFVRILFGRVAGSDVVSSSVRHDTEYSADDGARVGDRGSGGHTGRERTPATTGLLLR